MQPTSSRTSTRTRTRTTSLAVIVAAGVAATVALARPAAMTGGGAEPATTGEQVIAIEGFAFDGPATARAGTAIRVTNLDGVAHTLTFRSGQADTGTVAGGASALVTAPPTPGTHAFFCRIHPSMQGQIVLTG